MAKELSPSDKSRPSKKASPTSESALTLTPEMTPDSSAPVALEVNQPQPEDEEKNKVNVITAAAMKLCSEAKFVGFRGRGMIMESAPYRHFVPLNRERFDRFAYPILGGVSRAKMADTLAYIANTAVDLTENDHYILFGLDTPDNDNYYYHDAKTLVWDAKRLEFTTDPSEPSDPFNNDIMPAQVDECIWRSPYGVYNPESKRPVKFIMDLAGQDSGLYDDIMQSLAPLVMDKKPDGVIWWIGDGANGKSTLMDAIYRIFPGQLASLTVKRLVDGRDTPSLNGTLANVVKESSEGRVDDTEVYKALGTHEGFRVHKFHSQDDVMIRGNLHHIFSANTIPVFNDKGWSARRRTFIVPFTQRFESDPNFEERTFTPEFFGELIMEMCRYARKIRDQGFRYKWSATTLNAKAEYDSEANNAEEYARELIDEGVVAFESYRPLRMDYENWCAENGYMPLGMRNLSKAMASLSFERITVRLDGKALSRVYRLTTVAAEAPLQTFSSGRPGLYTLEGFVKIPNAVETVPGNFPSEHIDPQEVSPEKSVLKGRW